MADDSKDALQQLQARLALTLDESRAEARQRRHAKGYRTARENLHDLVDDGSFQEYGQLAVAAQRSRRDYADLQVSTAADGIITGTCTINADSVGADRARAAVAINDYSVLAGTQGYFHHRKLDRLCDVAMRHRLPVVMYTEGGGGRPGDTDVATQIAGLNLSSFAAWARLAGKVPRIAVSNGYCFAGNAALFGCADFRIATQQSWTGMAGPAMIEGGGLGSFAPMDIGPVKAQQRNGVVDIVAADEAQATRVARQLLSYFQGNAERWECADQAQLRSVIPADRRWGYPVRRLIEVLADSDTFLELQRVFGRGIITGFLRIEGRPLALMASDCQQLGGAVDAESADKAARFLSSCGALGLPVLSLIDTPGFMVGPDSEAAGAVRRMSSLFTAGAALEVPLIAIFLRKGYGLGAMAMAGGGFMEPVYSAAWPCGEFGGMGLEGAVRLGYSKELAAVPEGEAREALFARLVAKLYQVGKATEAAAHLEIDAVIDPADTRQVVLRALDAALPPA
ncbi:acyl-CoA carboxylase subunit beta [Chromatocurvus halotolerans]|uniref:Acetyl-CoA carboxylase carboxyltransferase component n=1 Tax=Chromatocurvus halotolerans TaxID=1132028 RepID=A0A4R2KTE7_9GAMM|nr:carboxyl transferase domain-containing protein [Chromatocurvus halotolerans]TCO77661.1 acetyl-CoA carboxylase carboxyltransferase component [Chromatocurvus halotolerans]